MAGFYADAGNHIHGLLRDPGGLITTFDVPGSIRTVIQALNDSGVSAGIYTDANNVVHGFIRQANGNFTTFDVPDATKTFVNSLNASGVASGSFLDASGMRHGFLRRGWVVHRVRLAGEPEYSRARQQRRTRRGYLQL